MHAAVILARFDEIFHAARLVFAERDRRRRYRVQTWNVALLPLIPAVAQPSPISQSALSAVCFR